MSVCVHRFNHLPATQGGFSWPNVPSTPIHRTRIQETAQSKKGTAITICPVTDREGMTPINKLKILHVRRTEEGAQSD